MQTATPREAADFLERAILTELAAAAHLTEGRARALIAQARMIVRNLPLVLEQMRAGVVSSWVASRIVDEAALLDPRVLGRFEADVVRGRFDTTDSTIIARVKRAADRWRTEPIEVRKQQARDRRRVWFERSTDGMTYMTAYLPTDHARALEATLTHRAKLAQDAGDPRTLPQLLADGLVEADLHGTASATAPADANDPHHVFRGSRVNVNITVPALSLMGQSDEPATMDGVGPISIELAKVLAANATSWNRILTHPVTGIRLAYDRTIYRVPADLKRWLEERDKTCRFPGCRRDAADCDVDHIIAWEHGGGTNADNLEHLCPKHHRLKHNTAWWPEYLDEPGTTSDTNTDVTAARSSTNSDVAVTVGGIRWHSPLGNVYDVLFEGELLAEAAAAAAAVPPVEDVPPF